MAFEIGRLKTLEEAESLAQCVYRVYGLTYHRIQLYEPEQTLALNRSGDVVSFVARVGDRCVGHIGAIRPFFEYGLDAQDLGGSIRELGQSVVDPEFRGHGLQSRLALAAGQWCWDSGEYGVYAKCVTHHVASQRTACRCGGIPCMIQLGGVPSWVRYDDTEPEDTRPISTLAYYYRFESGPVHRIWLPEPDRAVLQPVYEALGLERRFCDPDELPRDAPEGPSRLHLDFDPNKQVGWLLVVQAGPDLAEEVIDRFRWLQKGRLRHVTVIAPLNSPHTARAVPELKRRGLVLAGVLPNLGTGDMVVYQGVFQQELDSGHILTCEDLGRSLRDHAMRDWRHARTLPAQEPRRMYRYSPKNLRP